MSALLYSLSNSGEFCALLLSLLLWLLIFQTCLSLQLCTQIRFVRAHFEDAKFTSAPMCNIDRSNPERADAHKKAEECGVSSHSTSTGGQTVEKQVPAKLVNSCLVGCSVFRLLYEKVAPKNQLVQTQQSNLQQAAAGKGTQHLGRSSEEVRDFSQQQTHT